MGVGNLCVKREEWSPEFSFHADESPECPGEEVCVEVQIEGAGARHANAAHLHHLDR
jgi:hypothetical protein